MRPTAHALHRRPVLARLVAAAAVTLAAAVGGCTEQPKAQVARYSALPLRDVPEYMKGTVFQYTDMTGTEPALVSGYGLVANLHGTGDCRAPTPVRDAIAKDLMRNSFGSADTHLPSADSILDDPNFAIVRVEAAIPPGARYTQTWRTWFDVRVTCLGQSETTSLAHGDLYTTDLKFNGANPADPGNGVVSIKADAAGPIFVNPKYVLDAATDTPDAKASRRTGTVLFGACAMEDRPLILRLRAPERRLARAIEHRIIERFADAADDDLSARGVSAAKKIANAQDEGLIYVYVPRVYTDNWAHFAGVVKHLYLNSAPEFAAIQARKLAEGAVARDAPLLDISYAWEGLGQPALPALRPFYTSDHPELQYAAARAGGFIGDVTAVPALLAIADSPGNPYRANAVEVLASLPQSPHVDHLCRSLLDSDDESVREAAYNMLLKHHDSAVQSRWIKDGDRQVFALDIVRGTGPAGSGKPLVYCTRQGLPRVAVFGVSPALQLPVMFRALDGRLTIDAPPDARYVGLFYRGVGRAHPAAAHVLPDLPDVIAALAGDGDAGAHGFHFGYADVVAVLQALADQQKMTDARGNTEVAFVLQKTGAADELLPSAPDLDPNGGARPLTGGDKSTTRPADDDGGMLRKAIAPVAPRPLGPTAAAIPR